MNENLESLCDQIESYLQQKEIVIFRSEARSGTILPGAVYWDTMEYPDFRNFVDTALALKVRLLTLHETRFGERDLEEMLFLLSETPIGLEEKKQLERQLSLMEDACGSVGRVELTFDFSGRTYVFEYSTDWFEEYESLTDEIESLLADTSASDPLSGFFPTNN